MDFTYENQGTNTFLVYQISKEDSIDSMTLGMLTNNKIPGLASVVFTQADAAKYLKYNVSARVSAKQFFSGAVNKKRLIGVFSGIIDAMLSAEDYMIEPSSILLDMEYIFADVTTCEAVLICLPIVRKEESVDLAMFFKKIMFSTQFDQTENCDHVVKIINYLNSAPTLSLVNFRALLKSLMEPPKKQPEKKPEPARQPKPQTGSATVLSQGQRPTAPPQTVTKPPVPTPSQPPIQPKTVPPVKQETPVIPVKPKEPPVQETAEPEEKMSFLYLMRHYSKENAELYKKQKDTGKGQPKAADDKKSKKEKKPSKADKNTTQRQKFEVPGAAPATGFAVPGQTPTAASFAVPGQAAAQPASQETLTPKTGKPEPVKQPSVQPTQINLPNMPTSSVPSTGGRASFGETTVLNMGSSTKGETVVLNATNAVAQVRPYLIRKKNNEKILIDKPVYRIGKERSYVDYFIGDNAAISRSHANIVTRDGEYFIVDTNSKNHTYVEGEMLQSNMEMPVHNGSQIRMANEDFEFKLG